MKNLKIVTTVVFALGLLLACTNVKEDSGMFKRSDVYPVPYTQVKITDNFWLPKLKVYNEQSISHSWSYLQDVIDEAKGLAASNPNTAMKGKRWHESNLHKHLEAVTYALHQFPNDKLKAKLDSIIQLYASAQRDDGYFYLWGMSRELPPWSNLIIQHEDFMTGHLYEAAAFHAQQFDNSFLKIAKKSAQHAYKQLLAANKTVKKSPAKKALNLIVQDKIKKPNVLIINVDDLGWNDVQYNPNKKSPFHTPNISKLASEGMVFTNAYASSPVCSPTRGALVTGKSPARLKITTYIPDWIAWNVNRRPEDARYSDADMIYQLPLQEVTFAEVLKKNGYQTAFFGKWHLAGADEHFYPEAKGSIKPQFHPDKQGFDINIGGCAKGFPSSYFSPYENATIPDGPDGEYLTDRLTDELINFIKGIKNDSPFCAYLNYYTVHTPLQAKDEVLKKMEEKYEGKTAAYAAMIHILDQNIGEILNTLDELNIAENTLLVFTSDNGGLFDNTPLRSIKGTVFEGGIRVPGIVRFPPLVKPGGVCDEPIISTDLFPTLLDITHTPHCADKKVEGVSIVPLLKNPKARLIRDIPLFWHFPHYHEKEKYGDMAGALRFDNWKYIHFYDTGEDLLFDLSNDLAENNNCAREHPDRTEQMRRLLFQVLKQTHANMPKNISTKNQ